jgi:hypothetical protein
MDELHAAVQNAETLALFIRFWLIATPPYLSNPNRPLELRA